MNPSKEYMVSVILPNYNHSLFLRDRIESILNQTYQNFELIILDDSSTDNSKDIIESYRANPKVSSIIYNDKNSGSTFSQWRKGILESKGEYIWIAESDDYADIHFLEKLMLPFQEDEISHTFSMSYYVDEKNNITQTKNEVIENSNSLEYYDFIKKKMLYGCLIYNASMVVFKKETVINIDWNLISSFKLCGDWYFWNMTILNGKSKVYEVKLPLNYHRRHSSNTSSKKEREGYTFLEGFQVSKKTFNRMNLADSLRFQIRWYNKWQIYKYEYSFSSQTNRAILLMFLRRQPRIAFYELRRFVFRLLRLKPTIYIDIN